MKDFFGQELNIGDTVAVMTKNYRYTLSYGKVLKFTPKKIRVGYKDRGMDVEYLVTPSMLVKAPD